MSHCGRCITSEGKRSSNSSNKASSVSRIEKSKKCTIRMRWVKIQGLPSDSSSTFGGVVVSAALSIGRVPLLIDPQQQGKKWIKEKEKENGLKVVSLQTPKLQNILVASIRLGQPLLVNKTQITNHKS